MLCVQCANRIESEHGRCSDCGGSAVLSGQTDGDWASGRYFLEKVIGQGSSGTTYLGRDVDKGESVCIKELTVRKMASFEAEKLFRREGDILKQLDHPQIPNYIDHFISGTGKYLSLYLVQELVDGQNLKEEMSSHRYREDEVLELVIEILTILSYLHKLSPAVVHRDIKPSNVMRRRADDKLVLVDFGSVKDATREADAGGSTVAGTFGFMPPEQFYGKAAPASDLYALGVLMVVLLTRKDPSEMLDSQHQLSWERHVDVHPPTHALLSRFLQRQLDQRPVDAEAALPLAKDALTQLTTPPPSTALTTPVEPAPPTALSKRSPAWAQRLPAPGRPFLGSFADNQPRPTLDAPSGETDSHLARKMGAWVAVVGVSVMFLGMLPCSGGRGDSGYDYTNDDYPVEKAAEPAAYVRPAKNLPHGIKGLTFGMTLVQARAAWPEFEGARSQDSFGSDRGEIFELDTTLFKQSVACEFHFAVDDRLSRIACEFPAWQNEIAFEEVRETLLARFRERHGTPATRTVRETFGTLSGSAERPDTWVWQDAELRFAMKQTGHGAFAGLLASRGLTLDYQTLGHKDAIAKAERDEKRQEEAASERARSEREREELERVRALREALDDDL